MRHASTWGTGSKGMTRPGIGEGQTGIKVSKERLPADMEESGGPESPLGKGGSF